MSRPEDPVEWVRQARAGLGEVRGLLLRPTAASLTSCQAPIQQSIECLRSLAESLQTDGARSSPKLLQGALADFRRELQTVQSLMESVGRFHAGWGQLLVAAAAADAYTPRGGPAPVPAVHRLRLEG